MITTTNSWVSMKSWLVIYLYAWQVKRAHLCLFTINFRFIIWVIMIENCKHRYNSNSHFMPFKFILSCELYYLFFCWLYDIIKIIVFIWNIPNILPVRLYGCISHCPHECVLAFINFLYLFLLGWKYSRRGYILMIILIKCVYLNCVKIMK